MEGASPQHDAARAPRLPASLPALSLAVEGGVVLVSESGDVDFVSPSTSELHEGVAFDSWWGWISARLEERFDPGSLRRQGEHSVELQLPEPLGARRLYVRCFPVDDEDCTGYLVVIKDQRELDALQADLRLADQMRRLGATLRQATHDLKAPLQAMTLNLDMLRREIHDELGEGPHTHKIDLLEREMRRLGRMLQIVLSQSPTRVHTPRRFDLRRLVRELATLVRPQARDASIQLVVDTPTDKLLVVAVRDHLKQALLNLVINALEATPEGGHVRLRLGSRDGLVELTISDDGAGIPEALREKVFRLHFTTKSGGSGIGLFTARSTVERLGGSLTLESDGSAGTTARLTLPLAAFQADEEVPCSTS